MNQTCYCCKTEKPLVDFVKDKYTKSGYKFICRACSRVKNKEYRKKNWERVKANVYKWREENREYYAATQLYYKGHSSELKRKARKENRTREEARAFVKENKTSYDFRHKEKLAAYQKSRRKEINANNRKRRKEREKTDIQYKITNRLRGRLSCALRRKKKSASTLDLLGCTVDFFKQWLEKNFENGMTWDNYGFGPDKWNIDHYFPCTYFDLTDPEQQKQCFHWSNLFPMWQKHNQLKGDDLWISDYQI